LKWEASGRKNDCWRGKECWRENELLKGKCWKEIAEQGKRIAEGELLKGNC
jgi:hypothetical protein